MPELNQQGVVHLLVPMVLLLVKAIYLQGDVVVRVTLSIEAARDLPDIIKATLTKHFEKKGN